MSASCPPLEIILVNPQNMTEFIIISKEIKAGHISEAYVAKTLLPEIIKGRQEAIGEETDNGVRHCNLNFGVTAYYDNSA